jgi:hypothetical protein
MRLVAVAVTTLLTACVTAPVHAAKAAPSYARCEALSMQRGAGPEGPDLRAHRKFMANCLAGKVPDFSPSTVTPRRDTLNQGYDQCEAQSGQRTAGRTHNRFMADCMASKMP